MEASRIAASGMDAARKGMEIATGNLANVQTTAFSTSSPIFSSASPQTAQSLVPTGANVKIASVVPNLAPGKLSATGGRYDIAIQGQGYIKLRSTSQEGVVLYTRAGAFKLNNQGQLVDLDDNLLDDDIAFPDDADLSSIDITTGGEVRVTVAGSGQAQTVGQLKLYKFRNPEGLRPAGGNALTATADSGEEIEGQPGAEGFGTIQHKHLEGSNVDTTREISSVMSCAMQYELLAQVLRKSFQMGDADTEILKA